MDVVMGRSEYGWSAPRAAPLEGGPDGLVRWLQGRNVGEQLTSVLCRRDASRGWTPTKVKQRFPGALVPEAYGSDAHFTIHRFPIAELHTLPAGSAPAPVDLDHFALIERKAKFKRIVVGIVDTDIAPLHRQFRADARADAPTRLDYFWDQGDPASDAVPSGPWRRPDDVMAYGRELDAGAIDTLTGSGEAELEAYRRLGITPAGDWGHGTQVLALAAGLVDPLTPPPAAPAAAASACRLIAVQIDRRAIGQTHGTWLNARLLDALKYIMARADRDAAVVVNLSLGSYSGSHDGRGPLEEAIGDLIDEHHGRLVVVVAAGNGRNQRAHAQVDLQPAAVESLTTLLLPDDATPNVVDCWIRGAGAEEVEVTVVPPPGSILAGVEASVHAAKPLVELRHAATEAPRANLVALATWAGQTVGEQRCCHVQVTLAPTLASAGAVAAPSGPWSLRIHNPSKHVVGVHAWIGRDEVLPGFGTVRPQQAFASHVSTEATLSNLAWISKAVCVGAYAVDASGQPVHMLEASGEAYAAAPPGTKAAPDLVAPGGGQGLCRIVPWLSYGTVSPRRLEGTSLAAAVATRHLVRMLEERCIRAAEPQAWPAPNQLLEWLSAVMDAYPSSKPARGPAPWAGRHWLTVAR